MAYKIIKKNGTSVEIELDDTVENKTEQAKTDYKTAKGYIDTHERDIWRNGFKSYHMSTYDRRVQLGDQNWKQNISIGLVRSFVDVLKASVTEKPLTFIGTGVNRKGVENKENILNTLKYVSDTTQFHKQLKKTMGDGLSTGMIVMRVGYKKVRKTEKVISIVNNEVIEETVDNDEISTPYAVNVPVFNIFPDPYSGELRYVTERGVISYLEFINTFGQLIRSKKNTSALAKYVEYIPLNSNNADFGDYGNIVNQIHKEKNTEFKSKDFYTKGTKDSISSASQGTPYDEDKKLTEGMVEFKITWYESRVVLLANDYPVYVGPNIYGFIPYVVKPANETDARFGEGIPYVISDLEQVGNSYFSNYLDSARSIAQPTFVANKNLLINDNELQDGTPGGIIYTESSDGGNAVYRLDKGGLSDFGVIPLITQLAQQITGISEYNLGVSAGERTASGALAVTESSNKRMSPYISNFLDAISEVAYMWLKLIKKYWVKENFIYILDENGKELAAEIKNKDLLGGINLSLQAEGMFGAINELELQKLISLYQTLAPSGFVTSPEIAKEIIKKAGFEPSRFILEEKEEVTTPDNFKNKENVDGPTTPLENPNLDLGQVIQQSVNPQLNLGNGGEGQQ